MMDVLIDTLIDTLKIIPFLFIAFLLIEYVEHKLKNKKTLNKAGRYGPFFGAILGGIPQCGIAAAATNLYITRIVTLGTLMSVYLATSDEMIPLMLSQNVELKFVIKIVLLKILIGMLFGFIIDLIHTKKDKANYHLCDEEHCHCKENIFISSLKHTINITIIILIINMILNTLFFFGKENILNTILLQNTYFGSFITSLIGLIPNCGASVIITQLYLNNAITLGSLIGGLLTGAGIALIVLFKSNNNLKENLTILGLLYILGSISGLIIDLF